MAFCYVKGSNWTQIKTIAQGNRNLIKLLNKYVGPNEKKATVHLIYYNAAATS